MKNELSEDNRHPKIKVSLSITAVPLYFSDPEERRLGSGESAAFVLTE